MHRNALRLLATMLVVLGMLTLGVTRVAAQEELTVEVTFDPTIVPRTGQMTLSSTITCSEPAFVTLVILLVIPPDATACDRVVSAGRPNRPDQRGQHHARRHGRPWVDF